MTDASGIDDKSFNAAAWRGIQDFYGDTWDKPAMRGAAYDVVTAATQDMLVSNFKQAADEGYGLIIAAGFTQAEALDEVAPLYPDQKFLFVDVDWVEHPNIMRAVFAEHEGSFLVGAAAALKAVEDGTAGGGTAPRFGFIGGEASPTITKFEVGYIQGILSVLPEAQIVDFYVQDWESPELAKTQAKNWYDSGVYAIYSAAGSSGNGTIAQAKEYRLQGRNVWAIGVDQDQAEEGVYDGTNSAVLTSMIKRVESATLYALNAVKAGTFKAEIRSFDLASAGVNYADTNGALTGSIVAKLEEIKAKIISGEIKVAATYAEAKALPGFPQNLKALD
jgi:basic membrane protein A